METKLEREVKFNGEDLESPDFESSERDSSQSAYHRKKTLVKRTKAGRDITERR